MVVPWLYPTQSCRLSVCVSVCVFTSVVVCVCVLSVSCPSSLAHKLPWPCISLLHTQHARTHAQHTARAARTHNWHAPTHCSHAQLMKPMFHGWHGQSAETRESQPRRAAKGSSDCLVLMTDGHSRTLWPEFVLTSTLCLNPAYNSAERVNTASVCSKDPRL